MKVTIKDVAKAVNVSVATASMALNNKKGVSEKTRELVKMAAEALHYVPNQSARSLVTNESSCIGVIVPEITNPFYSEIVDILSKLIEKQGYTMLLGISNNKCHVEKDYINMFLFRRVAGVIVVPILQETPDSSHLNMLKEAGVPFVFCTERYYGHSEPGVMSNLRKGQYEMTTYLLEKGRRDICFVTSEYRADFTKLRMDGMEDAYKAFGLKLDKNMIFAISYPGFDEAYDIADLVLEKNPEVIMVINDIMAMGILNRLRERKISVPKDIWVTGFDDMKFSELATTPITTVKQPLRKLCEKSMELLFNMMKQENYNVFEEMFLIDTSLVIRETTN